MRIRSDLLGDIEATEEQLMEFGEGLFGFPECRRFALLPGARDGTFWLQSAEHSALAFLLVDPFLHVPGYEVDVPKGDLHELRVSSPDEVAVLGIVTLPRTRDERPTVNLQGPIALHLRARVGRQIVLPESAWGVRHEIDLKR